MIKHCLELGDLGIAWRNRLRRYGTAGTGAQRLEGVGSNRGHATTYTELSWPGLSRTGLWAQSRACHT
jgi:hypothetical protein